MTRELIERLPKNIIDEIDRLSTDYHNGYKKDETRARLAGYCKGLRDAGLITEYERKVLFVYGTI